MSVLLVDPDEVWGPAIARLLIEEGDEVRVLTPHPLRWATRDVYVAPGDPLDPDLIERACTNVRTVVLTFLGRKVPMSLVDGVLTGATQAGTDRIVACAPSADTDLLRALNGGGLSYVLVVTGRRGFLPKVTAEAHAVAQAVSAADDLAGAPRLVVDLTTEDGRAELRLA